MPDFQAQAAAYAAALSDFFAKYELPPEWFAAPDHLAYKCADSTEFEAILWNVKSISKHLSYIELNNRRLAAAELKEPLKVSGFGEVDWLEIMEPRPERVGSDVIGLEHMEFYFPDFASIRRTLEEKVIAYKMEENPSHVWVNIVINDHGQELKLNNGRLGEVVAREVAEGHATVV